MDLEFELICCLAAVEVGHQNMETKVTESKGVEPKVRTKTRLNAESYKIRKRSSFDNFDDILILQKIKKVTFCYIVKFIKIIVVLICIIACLYHNHVKSHL